MRDSQAAAAPREAVQQRHVWAAAAVMVPECHLTTLVATNVAMLLPAGAAMVYLYELAHSRHKGVTGSVGYISLGAGVVLGILVVNAVISLVPNGEPGVNWGLAVAWLF